MISKVACYSAEHVCVSNCTNIISVHESVLVEFSLVYPEGGQTRWYVDSTKQKSCSADHLLVCPVYCSWSTEEQTIGLVRFMFSCGSARHMYSVHAGHRL